MSNDKLKEAQCPDCGGSIADHQYHGFDGHDWRCLEPPPKPAKGGGMTPHFEAVGRRAVSWADWRWMPGMLHRYRNNSTRVTEENVGHSWSGWPDFSDPATRGCVLALAREAWKRPTAYLYYYGGKWFFDPQQSEPTDHPSGRTEAEALVAALKAAP